MSDQLIREFITLSVENITEKVNPNYLKGYSGKKKTARRKEVSTRAKEPHEDPQSYRPFKTDVDPKTGKPYRTKPSKWNKKFKKMFEVEQVDTNEEYSLKELVKALVREALVESNVTKSLKNKAKAARAPMGALRAIYNKGLAAWRTGHRKGASQHAWAMARVNSVLAGGPARKVDAAQWKQIQKFRGKKRKKKKG